MQVRGSPLRKDISPNENVRMKVHTPGPCHRLSGITHTASFLASRAEATMLDSMGLLS